MLTEYFMNASSHQKLLCVIMWCSVWASDSKKKKPLSMQGQCVAFLCDVSVI